MAQAAPIGSVESMRGAGAKQKPGEAPRVLGAGSMIEDGEVLSTGANSYAVIKLDDGTRMTLRPNSSFKVDEFFYNQAGQSDNLVMNLIRGGLRIVTGAITKKPSNSRLVTTTATVGIRGTDFDARICGDDCRDEARRPASPLAQANATTVVPASARVVQLQGALTAQSESGERRVVGNGGPAYRGDTLETAPGGQAVLVFRDDTRMVVQGGTRIRIEDFAYDRRQPGEGSFAMGLLRGGFRVVTGLIGKARPANVRFSTATATVGIRGTDFHMACAGAPAGETGAAAAADGCFLTTYEGSVAMASKAAPNEEVLVPAGSSAQVAGATGERAVRVDAVPPLLRDGPLPAPSSVPANVDQLFGTAPREAPEPGDLYVHLRDGHLAVEAGGRSLDIGRGESLLVDASGRTLTRLDALPSFLANDTTPRPDRVEGRGQLDLSSLGMRARANLVCKP
jgi:hypothetical protein